MHAGCRFFGGVPKRIMLDNASLMVKRASKSDPTLNPAFRDYTKVRSSSPGAGRQQARALGRASQDNASADTNLRRPTHRECLDHVTVLNERHLHRVLKSYFAYYRRSRTHVSLGKDSPDARPVPPQKMGDIVALPEVGGLHHRYERRLAA